MKLYNLDLIGLSKNLLYQGIAAIDYVKKNLLVLSAHKGVSFLLLHLVLLLVHVLQLRVLVWYFLMAMKLWKERNKNNEGKEQQIQKKTVL